MNLVEDIFWYIVMMYWQLMFDVGIVRILYICVDFFVVCSCIGIIQLNSCIVDILFQEMLEEIVGVVGWF